jgi:hypothetical protein
MVKTATEEVREEYLVYTALKLVDPSRYFGFHRELEKQELVGQAKWPKTQATLIAALDKWQKMHPRNNPTLQPSPQAGGQGHDKDEQAGGPPKVEGGGKGEASGPIFLQAGKGENGVRTNSKGESACHICGAQDHWKDECPKNPKNQGGGGSGVQGMQQGTTSDGEDSDGDMWVSEGVNFGQRGKGHEGISGAKAKVYFDSCTVRTTIDEVHLDGVTVASQAFSVLCNAGTMTMTKCGKLGDLPSMAREKGIANLISVPELESFFKEHGGELTYSSNSGWALTMNEKTIDVPTEPSGPCKGMPYLFIEDARKIFTVDKDVWSRVNVEGGGEKKMKSLDVKDAYRQLPVPILKNRCDSSSDEVSPKSSNIEVKWRLPKTKGRTTGRIVVSGNSHMQSSIRGNMEGLSKRQVIGALDARLKQSCMGATPSEKMRDLVRNNRLNTCSVTLDDLDNANFVFGPKARGNIRGSTTRAKPDKVNVGKVEIPRDFYKLHKFVTLSADVMFCNGLPFMTTVSHHIDFLTAEFLPTRTAEHLSSTLTKVLKLYGKNGFVVRLVHMDNEFACLQELLPFIEIELTAAGEHVCKIERSHRTLKNRARGVLAELLYSYYPTQMIIHLIYHVVLWLNATNFNLLPNISAREFITGMGIDIDAHCQQPFGQYCEPHDDQEVTNTMSPRTNPCICLGTTGNRRGTQKVLSLDTNEVVRRRNLKNQSIPVPDSIIRKVNELGIKNKKEKYGRTLEFLDRSKCPYSWTYEDEDEETPLVEFTSHPEMAAEIPGVTWEDQMPALVSRGNGDEDDSSDDESDDDEDDDEAHDNASVDFLDDTPVADGASTGVDPVDHTAGVGEEFAGVDEELPGVDTEFTGVGNASTEMDTHVEPDRPVTPRQVHFNSPRMFSQGALEATVASIGPTGVIFNERPRRARAPPRNYEPTMTGQAYPMAETQTAAMHFQQAMATAPLVTEDDYVEQLTGTMMMQQHYFQKGLKIFGKKGEAAVEKELTQMHDMQAYTPIDASTLSEAEKKDAINQLMFLTEKRCGKIKARSCADGRKQREYIKKEDASSPTVSLEAIMLTMAIEAAEGREVACIDIPGAFLHTDIDEDVVMQLRGKLAELMVQVDPKLYRKHIVMENGHKILYVKAQKAVYGLLRSSLLFYLKLKGDLERLGFEFNPYDPCTANKMIDGHQMTVVYHVDDLKVSHKDPKQIDWFADQLRKIYGEKLTVNRGKIHDYLGMMIDYSKEGKVEVSMIKFIKKIFGTFTEEIKSTSATPAAEHLFNSRDEKEAEFLDEERADTFHSVVAMLLFLCMRARRDIQTAVSYLTTRVKKPDEDDWGKLKRVLKYLKGTLYMKLTLEVDSLSILKWWIDASHNIHMDCRGHTGTMFSLGKGAVLSSSAKQKLNTKSSTESELVGSHDGLGLILWSRYFLEAQGYTIDHNILYQDNQSTMLLQRNGRSSSTKRTKHINARYFFIKDKIDSGEVEVLYCPTKEMRADINTKPLQGSPYRNMRGHLMNVAVDYDDDIERANTCAELGGPGSE